MTVKRMPVAQVQAEPPKLEPVAEETVKAPRKRRRAAVYDADGHEVLITLVCLKCQRIRPLSLFGLRKMADGAIRNQPWCRDCRGASAAKKPRAEEAAASEVPAAGPAAAPTDPGPA